MFRLTILELSCFALAIGDHEEAHSILSPELGGQHFEITNSDDSDESDELISINKGKTDACSMSRYRAAEGE